MSLPIVVDLLGIECNSEIPDADGMVWSCFPLEGWSAPDLRSGSISPTGRHGLSQLQALHGGRNVKASGLARGTQEGAWAAYYRLASILGLNESGTLVVHEPTPKQLTVTLASPPLMSDPTGGLVKWDLELLAEFPFKTSTTATTTSLAAAATVTLTNSGTAAAYPVITTTSSGTVDLVIGGRHFTTGALASGTVIDMWARTIRTASGVDVSPWPKVPATEWLALPPGASSVQQAGSAGLSVVHSHTYA